MILRQDQKNILSLYRKQSLINYNIIITLEGYVTSFGVTPASVDDREGLRDLAGTEGCRRPCRQGYGSILLKEVLEYIKNKGIQIVTIGVDETEDQNIRMYNRFGFTNKIKDCFEDPCNVYSEMKPKASPCFWLLAKRF